MNDQSSAAVSPDTQGTGETDRANATGPAKQRGHGWWSEVKAIFWILLAVLAVHSFIVKPFYIPSESMLPTLRVGDRLIVTKYPYGFSYVTPTFHVLPFIKGRLFGHMPTRGDIVIVVPPGENSDYIKRVIGLPGDRIEVSGGVVYLNGTAIPRTFMGDRLIPIDDNTRCKPIEYPGRRVTGPDGKLYCSLPIYRETLPNGRYYDTVDLGVSEGDNYPEHTVPEGKVFLMGDNRDNSADSRFSEAQKGLGGAVPVENIGGRAEFITFSLNGSATWNPLSWFGTLRTGRAGKSLHPHQTVK